MPPWRKSTGISLSAWRKQRIPCVGESSRMRKRLRPASTQCSLPSRMRQGWLTGRCGVGQVWRYHRWNRVHRAESDGSGQGRQGTRRGGPGRREGHGILRGYQLWNGLCRFRCEGIDAERQVRNRANIVQDQPSGDSGYRVAERRLYHEAVLQRRDLWRGVL